MPNTFAVGVPESQEREQHGAQSQERAKNGGKLATRLTLVTLGV